MGNTVVLKPNEEWQFEVTDQQKLTFLLTEGKAELFGTELATGKEYEFQKTKASVYTFQGCKLDWDGECESVVCEDSQMGRVANIHFALENMRRKAAAETETSRNGPVTILLGPSNCGKTTLSKILVSYAARMSRFPVLVNLDPESPVFGPPGSLTATPVSHILDIEEYYGLPPINGPSVTHNKQSLVYDYGLLDFRTSLDFYKHQIKLLADGLKRRLAEDKSVRTSGVVIDTPSHLQDDLDLLKFVLTEFQCDSAVLINVDTGSEVYDQVSAVPNLQIAKFAAIGAKENDDAFKRQVQRQVIQEYFFGNSRRNLSPFTITTNLADIIVYRPLEQKEIESSNNLLTKITPSAILQNSLLAVVDASPSDSVDKILNAETLGFVHVVEADEEKSLIKILLPAPGKLPKHALIMGNVKYHE